MSSCIFGVWWAQETLPLFDYIKETQATSHPLVLAGFDEQTSSGTANRRPGVFRSLIAPIDSAYARHVFETDSAFLRLRQAYGGNHADALVPFYDSLATFLRVNQRAIERANSNDSHVAIVARQAAVSMTYFVRQIAGNPTVGTEIRDLGMANNLDVLLNELYPGKRVMVWAHNFHVQHREHTRDVAATPPAQRTMGTWVVERHRPELYTIGLFMYRGSAALNSREQYAIAQSRAGAFESMLHAAPWRYSFLDFSNAKREPGSEWIWQPIDGLSWGRTIERFVPRDEYDAVLFIDTVHLPNYFVPR